MHRDQLPGAHRMRDRGKPRAKTENAIGRSATKEKGRDHISVIGSLGSARWSPSPGSARSTHVRRRRTRRHLLPSSTDAEVMSIARIPL